MPDILTVTVFENGFSIKGHAEYAEHGKDIVCSAVSFLSQSIAHELENSVEGSFIIESGNMDVTLYTRNTESDVLLRLLKSGIKALQKAYPNNIKLIGG